MDSQAAPCSSTALALHIRCWVRALPCFTPAIAQNCQGRSDGEASGLVRHISGFRGEWGQRGCCLPFGVQGGPVSSPSLQHWEEMDKWKTWAGVKHTRKLWEILRQLKFYNGKYQKKLNISAAICTAYSIKNKMYIGLTRVQQIHPPLHALKCSTGGGTETAFGRQSCTQNSEMEPPRVF